MQTVREPTTVPTRLQWFVGYDADGNKCKVPSQIVGNTGICYSMLACRFQVAF